MQYSVHVVGDHELPAGVASVIVERDGEPSLLLISGDTARCWTMMRAYEDTLEPCTVPTIALPAPLRIVPHPPATYGWGMAQRLVV